MEPHEYCRQRAAQAGSSHYYAFLFLPEDERRALTALHAFRREVSEVVDEVSETGAARMKLAWWQTELERMYEGNADHPVGRALAPFVNRFALPRDCFNDIIAAAEMDLDHVGYASADDLERYCHRAASSVALLGAEIVGYSDVRTRDYARDLGAALQLTTMLRKVRADARHGRVYIPGEDLDAYGVEPQDLHQSRTTQTLQSLFAAQARRARERFDRALAALPDCDRAAQRPGLALAAIYRQLLAEIERDGYRVLEHRVSLTPIRKLWIAWRTARSTRHRRTSREQQT